MELRKFEIKHMPSLVDRLVGLWSPPVDDMEFRRTYVEAIVRQNATSNDMQFMICDNGELCAVAFACRKGEHNSSDQWWKATHDNLSNSDYRKMLEVSRSYITTMDEKTYSYMTEEDVKLSLFVSTKSGWGKKILDQAKDFYREKGFKNMLLWTDCDCNVDWYRNHGYVLVEEDTYEGFSRPGEDYKTYVFKMKL
ncbi:hypothetical protein [Treponema sp.]|uniref:hypothetical protein n=1 Tax=Treponema sp. TaxID=166 RepID=UPI00298E2DE2|nr:hypothetical protein [Treponema sp.]